MKCSVVCYHASVIATHAMVDIRLSNHTLTVSLCRYFHLFKTFSLDIR